MKLILKSIFPVISFFLLFSYTTQDDPIEMKHHEIAENETFKFGENNLNTKNKFSGSFSFSMHSYDNAQYTIVVDKKGKIGLSNLFGTQEKHQNELRVLMSGGSVTRINDTIILQVKTNFKNLYFIKLDKEKSPETFDSEVKIKFVSKTLENQYCPTLISTSVQDFEAVALPSTAGTDEIFKKNHKDETVGIFTYLSVSDSKGKTMKFTDGDYVIIGGNSLKQEP